MAACPGTCPPKLEERRPKPGPFALPPPSKIGVQPPYSAKTARFCGAGVRQFCTVVHKSVRIAKIAIQFGPSYPKPLSNKGNPAPSLRRMNRSDRQSVLLSGMRHHRNKSGSKEPVSSPAEKIFFHNRVLAIAPRRLGEAGLATRSPTCPPKPEERRRKDEAGGSARCCDRHDRGAVVFHFAATPSPPPLLLPRGDVEGPVQVRGGTPWPCMGPTPSSDRTGRQVGIRYRQNWRWEKAIQRERQK